MRANSKETMLILNLYKFMGLIFIPIIKLNLYLRLLNGKENKKRFAERFGISSFKRPKGEIIWIHAASVGEFKSAGNPIKMSTYKDENVRGDIPDLDEHREKILKEFI